MKDKRVIISLDVNNIEDAQRILRETSEFVEYYKVGPIPFISMGIRIIDMIKEFDNKVFLDLKFNDIPNTIEGAVKELIKLDIDMFTMHATAGATAIKQAKGIVERENGKQLLIAVTVLTSLEDKELMEMGFSKGVKDSVEILATLAVSSGADGIVCSSNEIGILRDKFKDIKIIVPGIRFEGANNDDQKRRGSARYVIEKGADFIVIGRPIVKAQKPGDLLEGLIREINSINR